MLNFFKKNKYLIILFVIILIIIFHQLGWLFFISKIILPWQKLFSPQKESFTKEEVSQEIKKLKEENEKLILENIKIKFLEEENEKLRTELIFIKKEPNKRMLTNIVGRRTEGGITWFILDQGEKKGIKVGQAVVNEDAIVGKVIKTTQDFSYILPILNERVSLSGLVISQNEKNKISGIVRGKWGLSLELDWILLDQKLNIGDLVVTAGLEDSIPKGLLIGKIEKIETKPGALFQKAIIIPAQKIEGLEFVSVILK